MLIRDKQWNKKEAFNLRKKLKFFKNMYITYINVFDKRLKDFRIYLVPVENRANKPAAEPIESK